MYFNKKLFVWVIFILISPFSFAINKIVHYEPEVVKLEGIVETQTFPGRPNYESIKNGDEIEKGPYLRLRQPINVLVMPNDNVNEKENNVKIIQIVDGNDADWQKLKKGGRFRITGMLFHRLTGHHHSRVLIDVKQIEELK
jgi:hypothetical protein